MWQDGGILGLFRGNCATMAKVIPQTAIQFAVYDTIQDIMKASLQTVEHDTGLDRELPHLSKWQNLVAGKQICIQSKAELRLKLLPTLLQGLYGVLN